VQRIEHVQPDRRGGEREGKSSAADGEGAEERANPHDEQSRKREIGAHLIVVGPGP
jgi:hypothetical protein